MTVLTELWLPILLASVIVFVASTIIHMVIPAWHAGDYGKVPDQEKARAAIGPLAIPPGDYMLPRPDGMKDMNTPEFQAKLRQGPRMVVTVLPNSSNMGKMMALWFVYLLVVNYLAGYVARTALPGPAPYPAVFHIVAVTAFLGYTGALWQMSIWYSRSVTTTIKSTIDGLLYALLAAGTFGWLWPR